jgi:predicted pyridoxine 5'-phosphate oxidase superfamily flavin-nucleotide-binding protein
MNLITSDIKKLIERQPIAISTVMKEGTPNVIGVAFVKVEDNQLIVTDNYMNQTIIDVENNPRVAIVVWNKDLEGYKLLGKATYFNSGEWLDYVKNIPENKDMPAKGALVISIDKVIQTA